MWDGHCFITTVVKKLTGDEARHLVVQDIDNRAEVSDFFFPKTERGVFISVLPRRVDHVCKLLCFSMYGRCYRYSFCIVYVIGINIKLMMHSRFMHHLQIVLSCVRRKVITFPMMSSQCMPSSQVDIRHSQIATEVDLFPCW